MKCFTVTIETAVMVVAKNGTAACMIARNIQDVDLLHEVKRGDFFAVQSRSLPCDWEARSVVYSEGNTSEMTAKDALALNGVTI